MRKIQPVALCDYNKEVHLKLKELYLTLSIFISLWNRHLNTIVKEEEY